MTQNQQDRQENDKLCLEAWRLFLIEFNRLADKKESDKKKYTELKEKVAINPHLNYRQREAMFARCNYAIADNYGSTKTQVQMSHSKTKEINSKAVK